jgi:predicted regulator of Ras-like GTPase activity (Roadblock/LC7/MglB family)
VGVVEQPGQADTLRAELEAYLAIPGIRAAVLVSDDGLVISSASLPGVDTVGIAALAVDTVTSAQRFGLQVGAGYLDTMSIEFQKLTVVLVPFTRDVMLALIASPGCVSSLRATVGQRTHMQTEPSPQIPEGA